MLGNCRSLPLGLSKWGWGLGATLLWAGVQRLHLLLLYLIIWGYSILRYSTFFRNVRGRLYRGQYFPLPSRSGIKFEPIGAAPQDHSQWQKLSCFSPFPLWRSYTGLCSFCYCSLPHLNKPNLGVLRSQEVAGLEEKLPDNNFLFDFCPQNSQLMEGTMLGPCDRRRKTGVPSYPSLPFHGSKTLNGKLQK